jgi:Putative protein-S-isoprenylcysteine methyltransferase
MNTRIPPDLVLLICGLSMWVFSRLFPQFVVTFRHSTLLSGTILVVGLVLSMSGIAALSTRHTTVRPDRSSLQKASTLVTSGIYRYTRNPVYLGMAVMLLGWAFLLKNWVSLGGVAMFIAFITQYQIIPEERVLSAIFGDAFAAYRRQTRRWA